jgi:hypothetical protein
MSRLFWKLARNACTPHRQMAFIGRLYSDEQLVPGMMLTRRSRASAGKGPIQQLDIGDLIRLHPSPIGKFLAARAANLIPKELNNTVMNPVIVRFHDTLPVFVMKFEQLSMLNCRPD